MSLVISKYYIHSGLIIWCHTDTPYRQDPNSGEDKGGLLGPKTDKYNVCYLLARTHKTFESSAGWTANSARLLDIKTEVGT